MASLSQIPELKREVSNHCLISKQDVMETRITAV